MSHQLLLIALPSRPMERPSRGAMVPASRVPDRRTVWCGAHYQLEGGGRNSHSPGWCGAAPVRAPSPHWREIAALALGGRDEPSLELQILFS